MISFLSLIVVIAIIMKIAFISTRGIPNNYGGFEQFAEYISVGLVKKGHDVTVYSPHYHPFHGDEYKGVSIKHIYSPELWMGGSIGSFFYDYMCLKDALRNGDFDIIYEAGYTSIIPAYIRFDVKNLKKPIFTTNMDGLEYKRTKFNRIVRRFVFWEERMAVKHSHFIIADNLGIKDYYKEKYNKESKFLAYGASIYDNYSDNYLKELGLVRDGYLLAIARLEPENNIEMAIEGYTLSAEYGKRPLVIVGKTNTPYAKYLLKKYNDKNILFTGGIYDFDKINSIRYYSFAYFHGHSVGGTNPSLLEAMASECFILSHNNAFNMAVLGKNAHYFSSSEEVTQLLNNLSYLVDTYKKTFTHNNLELIRTQYSWDKLVNEHEEYFRDILSKSNVL